MDAELLESLYLPPAEDQHGTTVTHNSDNAAVIVFTSGTTGTPKGVVLTHSSLSTMMRAQGPSMGFSSKTRVLAFAAPSFDVSNSEVFTTLYHGGCVCVPSEHDRLNDLAGAVARLRANWLFLTPSLASQIDPASVPGLQFLALGGEPVPQSLVDTWASRLKLINSYGPSEASIWTSMALLGKELGVLSTNIGRGLGCKLWVVYQSNYNRLSPIGSAGELLIEGPILAREYLNDPNRTDEAFVLNPSWINLDVQEPNSGNQQAANRRLYKTGDLVAYSTDGSLIYMGRKDTQIKVRGQRVEIGQIEYHLHRLLKQSQTSKVAVDIVFSKHHPSSKTLGAYIEVMDDGSSSSANSFNIDGVMVPSEGFQREMHQLQTTLLDTLPHYMVPTVFIPMKRLPMTPSGKLDRRLLSNLLSDLSDKEFTPFRLASIAKTAPRSEIQLRMRSLWAEVLQIGDQDLIGTEDSFFQLGGDSLSAIFPVSLASKAGMTFTVADLFRCPKLCDIAAISQTQRGLSPSERTSEIPPFSLWEHGYEDLPTAIEAVADRCRVKADEIQDVYPCATCRKGWSNCLSSTLVHTSAATSSLLMTQSTLKLSNLPGPRLLGIILS